MSLSVSARVCVCLSVFVSPRVVPPGVWVSQVCVRVQRCGQRYCLGAGRCGLRQRSLFPLTSYFINTTQKKSSGQFLFFLPLHAFTF